MPKIVQIGRMKLHSWSESDVEHLRQLLPKIANGRKTRYQRKKKPQPGAAVPHKPQQKKKKSKP